MKQNTLNFEKVGVMPIRIVWSNVSSIGPSSERNRKYTFISTLNFSIFLLVLIPVTTWEVYILNIFLDFV